MNQGSNVASATELQLILLNGPNFQKWKICGFKNCKEWEDVHRSSSGWNKVTTEGT